jgi:predicted PurR-regulated permease PerM
VASARATRWSNRAFGAAFAAALLLLYRVVAPFLVPVLVAGLAVVLVDPLHEKLVAALGGRRRIAALISSLGVLLLLLVPAAVIACLLVREGLDLAVAARGWLGPDYLDEILGGRLPAALVKNVEPSLLRQVQSVAGSALGFLSGLLSTLASATGAVVLDGVLACVSMYYFFHDGRRLITEAARLSPLEDRYQIEFFRELRDVTRTMVRVNLLVAIGQGLLGAFGFWVAGIPEPLAFFALLGFASFLPLVGTSIVWVPAALVLLALGRTGDALFLAAWSALAAGAMDNVLRPWLAYGKVRVHPLLLFITLLGGVAAFGPAGILLGPLAAALFTAMLRIWDRDFAAKVNAGEPPRRRRAPRRHAVLAREPVESHAPPA